MFTLIPTLMVALMAVTSTASVGSAVSHSRSGPHKHAPAGLYPVACPKPVVGASWLSAGCFVSVPLTK